MWSASRGGVNVSAVVSVICHGAIVTAEESSCRSLTAASTRIVAAYMVVTLEASYVSAVDAATFRGAIVMADAFISRG